MAILDPTRKRQQGGSKVAKGTESAGGAARGAMLQDGSKMALPVVVGSGSRSQSSY